MVNLDADYHLTRTNATSGFTLLELLIVVVIAGVLALLLLPAVQSARESARRSTCQNNLRQIGIGLLSYEGYKGYFPVGAKNQTQANVPGAATFGISWWVEILPSLEQDEIYQRFDFRRPNNGWISIHKDNGRLIDNVLIPAMRCPSTSFTTFDTIRGFRVLMPSYVGLSGAASGEKFHEHRESTCCSPLQNGEISAGGVLVPNQWIRANWVLDGVSQTYVVGETSDFAWDGNGFSRRIDGAAVKGWIAGTRAYGTPPDYDGTRNSPSWNITTVKHPPNTKVYELPGISDNRGPNNPLSSPHDGGVNSLILDGAVRFLSEKIDTLSLKQLATRDDGAIGNSLADY